MINLASAHLDVQRIRVLQPGPGNIVEAVGDGNYLANTKRPLLGV